jgi:hypothetical protein
MSWPSTERGGASGHHGVHNARGILGAYGSVPERPPATVDYTDGPNFGHRLDTYHRASGFGHPTAEFHYPVTGMWQQPSSPSFAFQPQGNFHGESAGPRRSLNQHMGGLPKLPFPVFDGTSPKLWQKRCEDYFEMYATEEFVWVKVATMHFTGVANRWLQSVEPRLPSMTWRQFCQAVLERFGREQHELVIRKLFHIKQISSVQDYVDRFCELIDVLVTYEHTTDPLNYTMKFIDGLRDDIKSVILVQCPSNLDTVCALALLQEDADSSRRHEPSRGAGPSFTRPLLKPPLESTPRWDKSTIGTDQARSSNTTSPSSADSKVASLRVYRRARGLYQFCADKWVKGHKCAPTIQLHVMQELWDMLLPDNPEPEAEFQDTTEQFMMLLSQEAIAPSVNAASFRFRGTIQGSEFLILLDSGSSHCFLDSTLGATLPGITPLDQPLSIRVANGNMLSCTSEVPNTEWSVQGLSFSTTFKLVPLPIYDAILGIDWLEQFSPMYIDWKRKWMSLPYLGQSVILHGLKPLIPAGTVLEVRQVIDTLSDSLQLCSMSELSLPEPVTKLLQTFASVFDTPVSLPPSRSCDHSIPLVDGARPVNIRPYRISPALKDEVES